MCGIAGICNYEDDILKKSDYYNSIIRDMGETLSNRGPDEDGYVIRTNAAFAHRRLSVIDIENGKQPMIIRYGGYEYIIVYNGEIYNTEELREDLLKKGYTFNGHSDTEVILTMYIEYGCDFVEKLNGIYAFVILDEKKKWCYMARDRAGVKPFFYTKIGRNLIFASELKAFFKFPGFKRIVDREGLAEIFGIGPAKTSGKGVLKDVYELSPGESAIYNKAGLEKHYYWRLETKEHTDNYANTVEKVRYLLSDAIVRQLVSDVPICTLLSGGLDSSIISSVAARHLMEEKNQVLRTYSFDHAGNDKYFKPTAYQPDADRPFVLDMIKHCKSSHTFLECSVVDNANCLYDAVDAKDLPGMADVDSALLYYCRQIKKKHTVSLSGECADEIFGGYPWFHKKELLENDGFPWSINFDVRNNIINKELNKKIKIEEYSRQMYLDSIAGVARSDSDNDIEYRRRQISYLNIKWFMQLLLDRKDRMSMASGLEVRVPYADHRIIEYVYNVPWEYKCKDNVTKSLLKDAMRDYLPKSVIQRKKSPFPKTHNPQYELLVKERFKKVLEDKNSQLSMLIDMNEAKKLLDSSSDYGRPWFGQLMAGPQLIAYLIQVDYWLKKYDIDIVI